MAIKVICLVSELEVHIMSEDKRVWGIHTLDDKLFLTENIIAIGWEKMGDLNKISPDRESFKKKYTKAYSDEKKMKVATSAGMLYRFADASDEELAAVQQAAALAMASLDDFRKQEGKTLIADLVGRVDKIESLYDEIAPFEAARTESIRQRIRENIAKLGIEVDENRLEQEMIYYIEKLDITEERVRLHNHCKYFREVAANEPQAGRKLGFIAQEMGREINTTGSKANNHDIQTLVVQMKDELEKIKEQVLNLL